jgi:hypothetical protein
MDHELKRAGKFPEVRSPKTVALAVGTAVVFEPRGKSTTADGTNRLKLKYREKNLLIGPGKPLPVEFPIKVSFEPRAPMLMSTIQLLGNLSR